MIRTRPAGLAAAACLAALPVATPAAGAGDPLAELRPALRALQAWAVTYGLHALRGEVDLTWEGLAVDPRTEAMTLDGLTLRPDLPWDRSGACQIRVDRLTVPSSGSGVERLVIAAEIEGVTLPPVCLQPAAGLMLQSFGYDMLRVEAANLEIDYHLPSAGADILLSAAVAEAAEIEIAARFDYLWVRNLAADGLDEDGEAIEEAEPAAHLAEYEIRLENRGIWERLSPMLGQQIGDLEAAPQILRSVLGPMLAGEGGQMGPEAQAFVENAAEEVGRFVRDGDRLVLSGAPEGGVWLEEGLFQTPERMIEAFAPRLSATPPARAAVIPPDMLAAALSGEGGIADDARLKIGRALMTGVGAPRVPARAAELLAPLAEDWNAEAAALLAEARAAEGAGTAAYAQALRALAGGAEGAGALATRLEGRIGAGPLLEAQETALAAWPGRSDWAARRDAAEGDADIAALRRMSAEAAAGRGMPRSYTQAYYLASLAAAAGDRLAAARRDRLDARFRGPDGASDPAWIEARDAAAAAALERWTAGGLAARVTGGGGD